MGLSRACSRGRGSGTRATRTSVTGLIRGTSGPIEAAVVCCARRTFDPWEPPACPVLRDGAGRRDSTSAFRLMLAATPDRCPDLEEPATALLGPPAMIADPVDD